jgi:peptidoglycan/LPS O-acetylase OafA/YrhL
LLLIEALVGLSALGGGYGLLSDAEGLGLEESWLEGSPFEDYTIPGLFLLTVMGGGGVLAALLTWRRSPLAAPAAVVMGGVLVVWLIVETASIGFQGWQQTVFLFIYGVCALALIVLGARQWRSVAAMKASPDRDCQEGWSR